MKINVYSTSVCPNCKALKEYLNKRGIDYDEVNMATPSALTELRMNGVFTMSAPVLQVDNRFYTTQEICSDGKISTDAIDTIFIAFLNNG